MTIKRMIILGLLTAAAGILHIVESWLPLPLPVPGIKLGIANVVSLFALTAFGIRQAIYITLLRVLIGALLGGFIAGPAFAMSLSGGLVSVLAMGCVYRLWIPPFSIVGVSVIGAAAHNVTQVLMAAVLVAGPGLLWYIPYIVLVAVPIGIATGLTTGYCLLKMPREIGSTK